MTASIRDKIGTTRERNREVLDYHPERREQEGLVDNIPSDLMKVEFYIGARKYEEDLREILYFGRRDLTEISDQEIDKTLDGISEWQITLGNALAHIQMRIKLHNSKIDDTKAEGFKIAEEDIVKWRVARAGRMSADANRVSQEDRFQEFLRNGELSDTYRMLNHEMIELERQEAVLKSVVKVLEQRVTSLQGIARRRFKERTGIND